MHDGQALPASPEKALNAPQPVNVATTPAAPVSDPRPASELEVWLRARLPPGGRIDRLGDDLHVVHVARAGDTLASIAHAYLDLTTAYTESEFTTALASANGKTPGTALLHEGREIALVDVVTSAPKPAAESRLGWPEDKRIAGLYTHVGMIGAAFFPRFLERLAVNGMNAVVVDAKDYGGWVMYPSKIPLVAETHADSHAVVSSLERLVRVAHARGIRVLLRVSCFHDPWMTGKRPDLAIKGMHNWLNPNSVAAQDYLISIVDEVLPTGVDEIQLDYVRYPTEGVAHADLELGHTKTTDVIAGFVKRVHEHTEAAGVPLSIDVFGVVAWQYPPDVNSTGQDLSKLGPYVRGTISPMIYPSHFHDGFNGFTAPGDHPEVVAFGTKLAVEVLKKVHSAAVVRPWIQGFPWHASNYSAVYVAQEIEQSHSAQGMGWLAWNAGGYYNEVFAAAASEKALADRKARIAAK